MSNLLFRAQRPMNVRPAAPFNRSTNNNPPRYGYDENVYQQQYPRTNYQNSGPMFPSVYKHQLEDFQPNEPNDPQYSEIDDYLTQPTPVWQQQNDHEQCFERDSHSKPVIPTSQRFPQVNPSGRLPQRNATTAPLVRYPTPAVPSQTRNASAPYRSSGSQQQQRANKPGSVQSRPVVMLPPPKPNSAKRYPDNQSYQMSEANQPQRKVQKQLTQQPKENQWGPTEKKELLPYDQLHLFAERLLLCTIPQLFKWNCVRHKYPPVYEIIGTLVRRIETVEFYQRPMQSHFTLRNLSKWQERGKGKSVNDVLECVIYSTGKRRYNFSVDIHLRVIGRFLPSGLFHCIKTRRATESDLEIMTGHFTGKAVKSTSCLSTSRDSSFDEQMGDLDPMSDDSLDTFWAPF